MTDDTARVAHVYEIPRTRIRTFTNNAELIVDNSNPLSELTITGITISDWMYAGPTSDQASGNTGSGQELGFDQNIIIDLEGGNTWFKQYTNKTFKSIDDSDYFTFIKIDITDPNNHYNSEFIDTDLFIWLPGDSEKYDNIEAAIKDSEFVQSRLLTFHYLSVAGKRSYICYPGTIDSDDASKLNIDSKQLAVIKQIKQLIIENGVSTTKYVSQYSGTSNAPIVLIGGSYIR